MLRVRSGGGDCSGLVVAQEASERRERRIDHSGKDLVRRARQFTDLLFHFPPKPTLEVVLDRRWLEGDRSTCRDWDRVQVRNAEWCVSFGSSQFFVDLRRKRCVYQPDSVGFGETQRGHINVFQELSYGHYVNEAESLLSSRSGFVPIAFSVENVRDELRWVRLNHRVDQDGQENVRGHRRRTMRAGGCR